MFFDRKIPQESFKNGKKSNHKESQGPSLTAYVNTLRLSSSENLIENHSNLFKERRQSLKNLQEAKKGLYKIQIISRHLKKKNRKKVTGKGSDKSAIPSFWSVLI